MVRYEYWLHDVGEHYLVRLDDLNSITGVCGPLNQAQIPAANRQNYDYDSQPEFAEWMRVHLTQFREVDSAA